MQPVAARRTRRILVILSLFGGALAITLGSARSQTNSDTRLQFDVASVKLGTGCGRNPNDPGPRGPGVSSPGRLEIHCATVEDLIQRAYVGFANGVSLNRAELEIRGGPDWTRSQVFGSARYDISAKAGGSAHVAQMSGPMLQELLEDRFQLKIHRETKQGDVYALTAAKNGLKLRPTKEGSCTPRDLDHWPPTPPAPGQPNAIVCGSFRTPPSMPGMMKFEADGITIADFFAWISTLLLRQPVIDRTGSTGLFDFRLEFSRDLGLDLGGGKKGGGGGNIAPRVEAAGPSLPAALESQLGLKMAPAKGPVEFLVIDHVERPSEN
jgi:uncharacterized protein (TIGR03435 family)